MKRRFFDTNFAKVAGLSSQMPRVLRYCIDNRNSFFSSDEMLSLAMSTRNILRTPMAEFFERIVTSDQLNNFAAIYAPEKGSSIPEALTAVSLSIDLGHLPDRSTSSLIPEISNKVLLNLTGIIKADKQYGGYTVSAVDVFQNSVSRGHLCVSYHDADGWLPPYLAEFSAKSYSMILSGIISRYYDLTLQETLTVAGILAYYFCCGLNDERDSDVNPPLFNRCTWIGSRADLDNIVSACREHIDKEIDINVVATLIKELGPERMGNFSTPDLVAMCGNLGPDLLTSQIALEYPPYWVYMLLLALSGQKIPLVFQMNNQKLANEGRSRFLPQLLTASQLFATRR